MPLRLVYVGETTIPVEVEGILPNALAGKTLAEIAQLPIQHGNRAVPLGEFFELSGDAADLQLEFFGDLSGVHWLGARLDAGTIRVQGNVGRHLGSQMTGGQIDVWGNAGDWLGAEMDGGLIHIRGSAANQAGGAYRGSRRGMTGGEILIEGDAGDELGQSMRRGLIAVGGNCGQAAAFNMIAGTIAVLGVCGRRPAAGMRRGTLLLAGTSPPLLHTFLRACQMRPAFGPLLARRLQKHGFAGNLSVFNHQYTLYGGDLVSIGRGEILVRAS